MVCYDFKFRKCCSVNRKDYPDEKNMFAFGMGAYPIQELNSNGYIIDDMSVEELGFSGEMAKKLKSRKNFIMICL